MSSRQATHATARLLMLFILVIVAVALAFTLWESRTNLSSPQTTQPAKEPGR